MSKYANSRPESYEKRLRQSAELVFREASEYFMQRGDLYKTLQDITRRLDDAKIPYAVIGALALAQHGFVRMTLGIDLLLTKEGLAAFKSLCLGGGYVPAFEGAQQTFRAAETGVRLEIITSGEYPGDGLPKPISFPDSDTSSVDIGGIRVIALERLVELKLASGMSAPHRRRDLADVQDLIRALGLKAELAEGLDASVRPLYRQLWDEAHLPDKLQES
ncbi:hypothetical protein HYR99_11665 [Candidatus Poribacteria bacterium]|nr:hypothetical protein [Candidatus Poribacteria bacterium]